MRGFELEMSSSTAKNLFPQNSNSLRRSRDRADPVQDWSAGGMQITADERVFAIGQECVFTMKFKLRGEMMEIDHKAKVIRKSYIRPGPASITSEASRPKTSGLPVIKISICCFNSGASLFIFVYIPEYLPIYTQQNDIFWPRIHRFFWLFQNPIPSTRHGILPRCTETRKILRVTK